MPHVTHSEPVFADPIYLSLLQDADTLAPSEVPVLLYGETGTGKEVLARRIHARSGRAGPFVAVNCGAISEHLAESELFGHEAGSFTGAVGRREGWFEAAQEGTLFLDEVGDLPSTLQVKLLRAIQEREIVRVGSRKPVRIDIRIIAATSVDLADAMSTGQFRRDLYYRLNCALLQLPRLRDRPLDIVPLAKHFLVGFANSASHAAPRLTERAREALVRHRWQGNIRELENVLRLALLKRQSADIDVEHLRLTLTESVTRNPQAESSAGSQRSRGPEEVLDRLRHILREIFDHSPQDLHNEIERLIVNEAFAFSRFNQVHSANLLGISRSVLRTLLKRHGLLSVEVDGRTAPKAPETADLESMTDTYPLERSWALELAADIY